MGGGASSSFAIVSSSSSSNLVPGLRKGAMTMTCPTPLTRVVPRHRREAEPAAERASSSRGGEAWARRGTGRRPLVGGLPRGGTGATGAVGEHASFASGYRLCMVDYYIGFFPHVHPDLGL